MELRQARADDYEAVAAFTRHTWADRGGGDYIPDVYHEWIEGDGAEQRTFVLDTEADRDLGGEAEPGEIAGIIQGVLLSEYEGWAQGLRVNPDYRERGLGQRLTQAVLDWARERGAVVVRNMIFSWNAPSLGLSRAVGFDPATEFRWAMPEPDPDTEPSLPVTSDPDGGWAFWSASDAREHLRGLALDAAESWALSALTREQLRRADADDRLLTVQSGGTRAVSLRTRTYERESEEGETETWAEYGVGAWDDPDAAEALLDGIARDAGEQGADRTRVLIPESARWVSDAAAARAELSDEPDFVMAADLTDEADRHE